MVLLLRDEYDGRLPFACTVYARKGYMTDAIRDGS